MKLDLKNILESYFNEGEGQEDCPFCQDEEGKRSSFFAIASFMNQHRLAITPENFELAWAYVSGNNEELKTEILSLSADDRMDNNAARELYEKYFKSDLSLQIDRIVLQAIDQIQKTTEIIDHGNKNTRRCEDNLIKHVDGIQGTSPQVDKAIKKLVDLSRLMVESTRENREQIQKTNDKLAELQSELESARNEADFDQLTHLPNRRKFERLLDSAFRKYEDDGQPFVLAFADIDRFKRINDTFGHECGDRVLKLVADELGVLSDKNCHTSRYGGEEFAIIFEDQKMAEVFEKVDRCRESLAKRELVDLESGKALGNVTFSAGIAQCLPSDNRQSILRKADLALYEAKSEGRNLVLKYSK